jgi:hypothetical protein
VGTFVVAPSDRNRQPLVEPRVAFVPGRTDVVPQGSGGASAPAWLWASFAGAVLASVAATFVVVRRRRRVTPPPGPPAA